MKPIISSISKELLSSELTDDKFVRYTNYGENKIYVITHHNAPNVMLEIGRLRELSFRAAGGGTGDEVDIDHYDVAEKPYKQLIVWSPADKEIVGGYRFMDCATVPFDEKGEAQIATAQLFQFTPKFNAEYLPYLIELGRSFVQPDYQSTRMERKTVFALDNLWDGLGALVVDHPHIKYFFGKVTMYTHFNQTARDMILFFMHKYFGDKENLVYPHHAMPIKSDINMLNAVFSKNTYEENYKILNQKVREYKENIPPLFSSYMNLSATMKTFGTSVNEHFGDVEETGILIKIDDIFPTKKLRHITTYEKNGNQLPVKENHSHNS